MCLLLHSVEQYNFLEEGRALKMLLHSLQLRNSRLNSLPLFLFGLFADAFTDNVADIASFVVCDRGPYYLHNS